MNFGNYICATTIKTLEWASNLRSFSRCFVVGPLSHVQPQAAIGLCSVTVVLFLLAFRPGGLK